MSLFTVGADVLIGTRNEYGITYIEEAKVATITPEGLFRVKRGEKIIDEAWRPTKVDFAVPASGGRVRCCTIATDELRGKLRATKAKTILGNLFRVPASRFTDEDLTILQAILDLRRVK